MADVARCAGVHPATVSRALRRDPRITRRVQDQVRAVAEKMGYRLNPLLSALSTMRRQRSILSYQATLAYIVRRGVVTGHLKGAQACARQRGYKVERFELGGDLSDSRLDQILLARGIQGVILGPLPEAHGHFGLDWPRLALAAIEYSFTEPAVDRVVTDSYGSMRCAVEQCCRLGYRRIGLALASVVDARNEGLLRAAYYLEIKERRRVRFIPPLILHRSDVPALAAWMKRNRPDVLFSSNTSWPLIKTVLHQLRLSVPRDIGLINLNTDSEGRDGSGICQDAFQMGAITARLVIDKMNFNDYGVPKSRVTILTPFTWIEGKTIRSQVG